MAYTGTSVAGGEGNTTFNATDVEFAGRNLEFFTVDFGAAVNAKTAKDSAQYKVELVIGQYANIVAAGPLADANKQKTYMVDYSDAYVGSAAAAGGSFSLTTTTSGSALSTLQTAIQALGTVDSINLSSQTAKATKLAILSAAVVA
jgi:hypothetical protein